VFDLSENKSLTVAHMFELGWDVGGVTWKWRRRLLAWKEETLVECRRLLLTVVLHVNVDDVWSWILDHTVDYTVRGAYCMLTSGSATNSTIPVVHAILLWRKNVPLKVSIFGWRLFRNRLPTKANLF